MISCSLQKYVLFFPQITVSYVDKHPNLDNNPRQLNMLQGLGKLTAVKPRVDPASGMRRSTKCRQHYPSLWGAAEEKIS